MFSTTTMLEHHLQYNHFPPQPVGLVPFAARAIELANEGNFDTVVELPHGEGTQTLVGPDGSEATASDLVESLHLHCFLEDE